ncbi:GNAT family N-acetyltransferase [Starkeya sp. ORNL1]|uniref:GNAT family N-acetyltransferase n=1 Tax=Starkeya sp. ORNL1 TaxID=2709380 RepID=UPI0014641D6E|nr:GNAT family N-acetyltransferase [Starkeya sp. ORNL1]QJP12712.1 GNAT family N-acetyltransferase [Starkeya sp. ORNL1]
MSLTADALDMLSEAQSGAAITRVAVHDGFDAAGEAWRHLEHTGLLTPYQHRSFVETWWREIGCQQGIDPLIAVGHGPQDEPAFLWPLGWRRRGALAIAEPLGGKHANFHFGPWSDAALGAGRPALEAALVKLHRAAPQIDVLTLSNQAVEWRGRRNPFALLAGALPSPSDAYRVRLDADPEAYLRRVLSHDARKQVRAKTRKFESMPGFRVTRAEGYAETTMLLDAFLSQKAAQFAQMGVPDPFAAPGTRAFLDTLTDTSLDLYGLHVDGAPIAVFGGIGDGRRFSGMFMSYSACCHARLTPGYVLTAHVVADLCRRGYESFDLGVGEARYKTHFCNETESLVDVVIPLSITGRLYAIADREARRAKRAVKRSPLLWNALAKIRRLRAI